MAKVKTQDTGLVQGIQKALLDDSDFLKVLVQENLQQVIEKEFEGFLQAHPYERTEARQGYRNGSYRRKLKTRVGTIEIEVLRDREGRFSTELFRRYQRVLWNNKKKWLAFSNAYLKLPGVGKLRLSIMNDISQRKEAEIALAKSEERYRILFNNVKDAVFVNYLTADKQFGPFIEVNDAACDLLVFAREDLLKRNIYMTIPQQEQKKMEKAIEKLFQKRDVIIETFLLNNRRKAIPVELSVYLFDFSGRDAVLFIARDITERKEAESKLRAGRQQLRNLATRLQNIREEERTMIAREIHDELGQVLSVLKIRVFLLAKKIKSNMPEVNEQLQELAGMIDQSVESVQRITAKLRPGILDELGLPAAIQWQVQDLSKQTGIQCRCSLPRHELHLPSDHATAIFRILQEALTNVVRHANAEKVSIFLRIDGHNLILEVTDNGIGISKGQIANPHSLGLLGMKERAMLLGGQFKIYGAKGEGTNVKVTIPLDQIYSNQEKKV